MLNKNIPKNFFKTLNEKDYYIKEKEHYINLKDNSNYNNYNDFLFSNIYKEYINNRFNFINNNINYNNWNIMDICCWVGNIWINLYDKLKSKNIDFIDISETQLNICKIKWENILNEKINIINNDIAKINNKNYYDLIIWNSFLHHFPDLSKYLKSINDLLKENWTFIVLHEPSITAQYTESFPYSIWIKPFFKKIFIKNYKKDFLTTDLWVFNKKDLVNLLEKSWYKEIIIKKNWFLSYILVNPFLIIFWKNLKLKNFLYKIKIYLEKIDNKLQYILPDILFWSFLIYAKK